MSVGKPLIAIMSKDSEIGSLVSENNLGKQFDRTQVDDIAKFILEIKDDEAWYSSISDNVREKFKREYERKIVTKKFYDAVIK